MRLYTYLTCGAVALSLTACAGNFNQLTARTATETPRQCAPITKPQVSALFARWNASLATSPEQVVTNYAKDSLLLATMSNTPRKTEAQIADYFAHFLQKQPKGKIIDRAIHIDCNTAVDAGLYDFTFNDGQVVHARYTFVYKYDGKQWLISHHHSSAMPEAIIIKSAH